jgi:hypothetical protein
MPTFGCSRQLLQFPDDETLVTPRELPALGIRYHPNHLRRLWTGGRFPRPIRLSPRRIAWRKSEILQWIAAKERVA